MIGSLSFSLFLDIFVTFLMMLNWKEGGADGGDGGRE